MSLARWLQDPPGTPLHAVEEEEPEYPWLVVLRRDNRDDIVYPTSEEPEKEKLLEVRGSIDFSETGKVIERDLTVHRFELTGIRGNKRIYRYRGVVHAPG